MWFIHRLNLKPIYEEVKLIDTLPVFCSLILKAYYKNSSETIPSQPIMICM